MVSQQEFSIFWYKNVAGQKHCKTAARKKLPTEVWDSKRKAQVIQDLIGRYVKFGKADLYRFQEARCKLENEFGVYILTVWTAAV